MIRPEYSSYSYPTEVRVLVPTRSVLVERPGQRRWGGGLLVLVDNPALPLSQAIGLDCHGHTCLCASGKIQHDTTRQNQRVSQFESRGHTSTWDTVHRYM